MKILAFDPGNTTGWAEFEAATGEHTDYGQLLLDDFLGFLNDYPHEVERVIFEDYAILPHKANKYQMASKHVKRQETAQAIGAIKSFARRRGVPYTVQRPDNAYMAALWTQIPIPKDHSISHWPMAFNHGAFWLINEGRRKTALEDERGRM